MKVCVYGAGAIGGHMAGRLFKGGAEVSVVARGPHLAAIQRDGLRVLTGEEEIVARVAATADAAELGPQDAVIVATKAPSLGSVAAGIGPLLGPETSVTFMLNGIPWWYNHQRSGPDKDAPIDRLDPGRAVQNAIGFGRAIGGVAYSACTVIEPGVIKLDHPRNRFVLGEPNGTLSARIEALAAPLRAGGVTIEITDKIRDVIWSKLMVNLGGGILGVLSGSPPCVFYAEEACRMTTKLIVAEAAAIAAAMGCTVAPDPDTQIRNGSKSSHKTSILQDLELGRPMEIDSLYSVPLDMARRCGVSTPTMDMLIALIKARARSAGLYAG